MGADPSRTQIDIGEQMIGATADKKNYDANKDTVGKSLHISLNGMGKKLKGTRFNLNDPTTELPSEIMEKWID